MGNELSTKITSCCVDKPKSKYEDENENDTNNMSHGHRKLAHIRSISPKQQSVQYCITPLFTEDEENNLSQEEKDERCKAHYDQILIRRELIDFFVDEATARKMLLYQHGFTMRLMRQQMNEEYDELMMMLDDEIRDDHDCHDDEDEEEDQEQQYHHQEQEERSEQEEEEVYSDAAADENDVSENGSDREDEQDFEHDHHHHNESPLEGKDALDETAPALDVDQDTNKEDGEGVNELKEL